MSNDELADIIANRAYDIKYADDHDPNPDIGFGMFWDTIIDLAVDSVKMEGRKWTEKPVVVTEEVKKKALEIALRKWEAK